MAIEKTSSREHRSAASRLDRNPRADRGRETRSADSVDRKKSERRDTRSADSVDRSPREERPRDTRSADSVDRAPREERERDTRSADSAERNEAQRDRARGPVSADAAEHNAAHDSYTPSEEANEPEPPSNLDTLNTYYNVYDNPGGGDTDGEVSADDIADVASGDYDREAAEARLRDQGVSSSDIADTLDQIEATARHYDNNEDEWAELDGANDGGDTDGKVSRGDVDRQAIEQHEAAPVTRASEEERAEAAEIYREWGGSAEAVTAELEERPDLNDYSPAELLALAQAGQDDEAVADRLRDHVLDTVNAADTLSDLPRGEGFQYLLGPVIAADPDEDEDAANAQEHLRGIIDTQLESSLDERLRGRSGDSQADAALERWGLGVQDLANTHPALSELIASQAEQAAGDGSQVSDVRRDDDGLVRQVYHGATDIARDIYGGIADGVRAVGTGYGYLNTLPARILGETADWAITSAGQVAGAGLDAVGADGVADGVRDGARRAGNGVNSASDWGVRQGQNFYDGFFAAPAGLVEGVGQLSTNPIGVARGLNEVSNNPALLIEPYRQRVREDGYAGLAGSFAFDAVVTAATGGASTVVQGSSAGARAANFGISTVVPLDATSAGTFGISGAGSYAVQGGPAQTEVDVEDVSRHYAENGPMLAV